MISVIASIYVQLLPYLFSRRLLVSGIVLIVLPFFYYHFIVRFSFMSALSALLQTDTWYKLYAEKIKEAIHRGKGLKSVTPALTFKRSKWLPVMPCVRTSQRGT